MGKGIEEKVAAFEVNVVPKGTVVWEMEDHPNRIFQGIVDRPVPTKMDKARHRSSMNTNEYDADGSIRVLLPDKNGDYAFLLHILASLKSTGKGAIILPHGVLFRGNAEAERKTGHGFC